MTTINLRRVYDDPAGSPADDGLRVYVDRLWPRGESKTMFHYDLWAKNVAPSTELREWFHADPENRWDEFEKRYTAELKANPAVAELVGTVKAKPLVTLLYSSKDHEHNNALVLARYLKAACQDG